MFFVFVILIFLGPTFENQILTANEHVTLEMNVPKNISISKQGEITFFFSPIEGIHINTIPVFELRLDKNSAFEIIGKPKFQKNDKDYLDIAAPIEFSVKPIQRTKPGKHILKGKLNYFYCSDKEGWCNRFTQPVDVTIEVIK